MPITLEALEHGLRNGAVMYSALSMGINQKYFVRGGTSGYNMFKKVTGTPETIVHETDGISSPVACLGMAIRGTAGTTATILSGASFGKKGDSSSNYDSIIVGAADAVGVPVIGALPYGSYFTISVKTDHVKAYLNQSIVRKIVKAAANYATHIDFYLLPTGRDDFRISNTKTDDNNMYELKINETHAGNRLYHSSINQLLAEVCAHSDTSTIGDHFLSIILDPQVAVTTGGFLTVKGNTENDTYITLSSST